MAIDSVGKKQGDAEQMALWTMISDLNPMFSSGGAINTSVLRLAVAF